MYQDIVWKRTQWILLVELQAYLEF